MPENPSNTINFPLPKSTKFRSKTFWGPNPIGQNRGGQNHVSTPHRHDVDMISTWFLHDQRRLLILFFCVQIGSPVTTEEHNPGQAVRSTSSSTPWCCWLWAAPAHWSLSVRDPGTPTHRTGASSKKNTIHDPLWGEYLLVLNLGNFREWSTG